MLHAKLWRIRRMLRIEHRVWVFCRLVVFRFCDSLGFSHRAYSSSKCLRWLEPGGDATSARFAFVSAVRSPLFGFATHALQMN